MLDKDVTQLAKADIDALVTEKVAEIRNLEYKEKLPDRSDPAKLEFLADISSFGNASGGFLLYGIKAEVDAQGKPTGRPEAALGLKGANGDAEINSWGDLIRRGISPRLRVEGFAIGGFPLGPVIAFHVPASYARPHMVSLNDVSRFYSRHSVGKYQMDVREIRDSFLASESLGERVRQFREGRIERIRKGNVPVPLENGPRIVMHVIPLAAESRIDRISVPLMPTQVERLGPLLGMGWNFRFNLDGFLTFNGRITPATTAPPSTSYVQVFRTGALEAVDARTISIKNNRPVMPGSAFETRMVQSLERYLEALKNLGVSPPMVVGITLMGVLNCVTAEDVDPRSWEDPQPLNEDLVPLPEVLIEEYGVKAPTILRSSFDIIWQSMGRPGSPYFNSEGKWDTTSFPR